MCIHIHICLYVYICVFVHMCVNVCDFSVCIFVHIVYVCIDVCVNVFACPHVCMFDMCVYICMCVYMYMWIYVCVYLCMYMYVFMFTCMIVTFIYVPRLHFHSSTLDVPPEVYLQMNNILSVILATVWSGNLHLIFLIAQNNVRQENYVGLNSMLL